MKLQKSVLLCVFLTLAAVVIYFASGCEKIPTGVMDNRSEGYQIIKLNAQAEVNYNTDSSFVTSLKIDNAADIKEIWIDVSDPGGTNLFNHINLFDNGDIKNADSVKGDNVFSAKVYFSKADLNGKYKATYYINANGETGFAAVHNFNFYNGQSNYPPVISNLIMPDTVKYGESFVFTVKASSPSGLRDIKRVFFKFYRQDGSVSDVFDMHDDGDINTFGDQTAADGIYSFKNSFLQSVQGQSRKFVFQAVSQNDSLSNIIIHNIYVK